MESEGVLEVARRMCIAVRTAPKGKGTDNLVSVVLTGTEKDEIAREMQRIGEETGDTIKGVGASPGRVTAPACVLHGPEEVDRMRPGSVLVAAITTPAWTPLFAMASGVVTDVGGPLSHGSIVAREYGIPAVLGTGVATKRIQNGQSVTVDGSAGEVILVQ